MNTELNLHVRKSDTGVWFCEFVLLGDRYNIAGATLAEAVQKSLRIIERAGDIAEVHLVPPNIAERRK